MKRGAVEVEEGRLRADGSTVPLPPTQRVSAAFNPIDNYYDHNKNCDSGEGDTTVVGAEPSIFSVPSPKFRIPFFFLSPHSREKRIED